MMNPHLVAGIVAMCAALLFTPLVRLICMRLHLYDPPGPLKIHSHPIARLGGISLTLAFVLGLCFSKSIPNSSAWSLIPALALIWFTGLADDLRGLSPWIRLIAQIASATILWHEGWRLPFLGGILNWLATGLFVIAFANALNFLDGADGLAAGSTAIIAVGYAALPREMLSYLGVAVAWSLLGTCLGFIRSNFPPAKIHMGDSGSTTLGFTLAFLALDSCRAVVPTHLLPIFPIIFAALPLLDAAFAVLRRLRNGLSPLSGDRRHFYDLLVASGWSCRKVSLICYSVTGALVTAGLLSVRGGLAQTALISTICLGALLAAGVRLGSLSSNTPNLQMQEQKTAAIPENARPSAACFTLAGK